ncbi:MAG: four-carbon acid sugar kinase family protein [Granulosicoccus sp.]
MTPQPQELLLAWYGDDYTGSAAVLEVLAFAGVKAMLFLEAPTQDQLARYSHLQAIGVASTARAQSPDWMNRTLPSIFGSLLALQPGLFHYKICSTLDSSPTIGSIGCAIEIADHLLDPEAVPVMVAAPQMRRYQLFGHLFAGLGDEVYRLDRHPVMTRHPVTPMTESDVARHISAQSKRIDTSLWSLEDMATGCMPETAPESDRISVLSVDCVDENNEAVIGQMLWNNRAQNPFVVGSQGVEYALVRHWSNTGTLPEQPVRGSAGRSTGMVSVSGSVSPTTAEQIDWSRAHGFQTIRFDVLQTVGDDNDLENEISRVVADSLLALSRGTDPLVYSAEGPDDPMVSQLTDAVVGAGLSLSVINEKIGVALGKVLYRVINQGNIRRAVVSGGDTSGYVTQQLGIFALSALAPTIAGASLSIVHADGAMDGLELALKGGQMGSPDYFGWIRDGGGIR